MAQDDRIVFLANVWLDRPDTFEALHTLLSGELRSRKHDGTGCVKSHSATQQLATRATAAQQLPLYCGLSVLKRGTWALP